MERFSRIISVCAVLAAVVTGCSETEKFNEFGNWQEKNDNYIATLSQSVDKSIEPSDAAVGVWFRIPSYKLDRSLEWNASDYVYCRIIRKTGNTVTPNYSDSIRMNYRGRLIPSTNYPKGLVFVQSYKTDTINTAINVETATVLSESTEGFITAIQYMPIGDTWEIVIPYNLAYGSVKKNSIPAYSTLIYNVNLTEAAAAGTPLSPR